jgi:hypothetical protein
LGAIWKGKKRGELKEEGEEKVFNRKKLLMKKLYSISYGKNARYFLHFVKTINLKYSMPFFLADTTI